VDVKIISQEGIVVLHSLNSMNGRTLYSFAPGQHTVAVQLPNRLAPGNYSITAGIHNSNGITLEYVEDAYPFTGNWNQLN
jgi:hypothetical protein